MKAKIIGTNQIIDVHKCSYDPNSDTYYYKEFNSPFDSDNMYNELDLDFEDIIDWEQRKFDLAKDLYIKNRNYESLAIKDCIKLANKFIKEYKRYYDK